MGKAEVSICSTDLIGPRLCEFVKNRYDNAVALRGKFHIALSGGSLPKFLTGLSERDDIDWSKVWIYFCDERHVPLDNVDSNYLALKQHLLSLLSDQDQARLENQILKINSTLSVEQSAREYEREFRLRLPSLKLDLALCGMGPDGHTCSLFPNHPLLQEETLLIAPISDSPKPPSCRITMTYPLLRMCDTVAFVVTGESKKSVVVSSLLHDPPQTPAGRVVPESEKLFWFLDTPAAAEYVSNTV